MMRGRLKSNLSLCGNPQRPYNFPCNCLLYIPFKRYIHLERLTRKLVTYSRNHLIHNKAIFIRNAKSKSSGKQIVSKQFGPSPVLPSSFDSGAGVIGARSFLEVACWLIQLSVLRWIARITLFTYRAEREPDRKSENSSQMPPIMKFHTKRQAINYILDWRYCTKHIACNYIFKKAPAARIIGKTGKLELNARFFRETSRLRRKLNFE